MWSPCLEGPGTHGDTMDSAGPLGPAWMRLVGSPRALPSPDTVLGRIDGAVSHCQGKCVTLCSGLLIEGPAPHVDLAGRRRQSEFARREDFDARTRVIPRKGETALR